MWVVRVDYLSSCKLKIMSMLKFNDGETFDLSGPLRVELRKDGWYVIGENMLIPVTSQSDGRNLISQLKVK